MQSQHGAQFNHDPWADSYDTDVQNELDPVRAGYPAVLAWTVARAEIGPADVVVDLGSGTGNTTLLIPPAARIYCVDLSARMTELARPKLAHRPEVHFIQSDLLGFFHADPPPFDVMVSTYAVHHLTTPEKGEMLQRLGQLLPPAGRAVFGDLMVENESERARLVELYRNQDDEETVEGLVEEFYWEIDQTERQLAEAGLTLVELQRFSELSWGLCVRRSQA
jgi:putative AdoMet-dependent methyltransferase